MNTVSESLPAAMPLLASVDISVRWRDLDALNHVNNSTYLTYLEEARVQWLQRAPGRWGSEHAVPVMVASELNYRLPIEWPGQVQVELYCARLGNSSMTIAHRIVDASDSSKLYCDGHVVMVWMDPTTGKSVPLPHAVRSSVPG
jgi:acyl-CoA thioester hydrolase